MKTCTEELRAKQQANQAWGIDTFDRWDLDQAAGTLVFSRRDGAVATCLVQIVGIYNTEKKTWNWAWDNPMVAAELAADGASSGARQEASDREADRAELAGQGERRLGHDRPGGQGGRCRGSLSG